MKKSILDYEAVQVLSKNELRNITGSWNHGHPPICGVLGFPPCHEK